MYRRRGSKVDGGEIERILIALVGSGRDSKSENALVGHASGGKS